MRTRWLGIAAVSLALGGCSTTGILGSADLSPDAGAYVASATAGDLFEMQASQLALTQAQRPDVRALAQELIEAHGQTTQRLAAAALASGMSAPVPALTGRQQQMLGQLQAAGPDSFDGVLWRK